MPPSARRRARLNQAAALAAVTAAHGLVFALIGLNVPHVRRVFIEDRFPPMVVDLLRPPPPRTVRRPSPPDADVSRPTAVR
ncbi:MAG: hypothetical protein Q7U20_00875, partial [Caulobacter sp.]|nr:hypothetical protein [Caulobacter sp.]